MPANVQTMAYYGETPWHGLGIQVPKGLSAEKMNRAAGLDWKVELRPARGEKRILPFQWVYSSESMPAGPSGRRGAVEVVLVQFGNRCG